MSDRPEELARRNRRVVLWAVGLLFLLGHGPLVAATPTNADRELLADADLASRLPATFRMALDVQRAQTSDSQRIEIWRGPDGALLLRLAGDRHVGKAWIARDGELYFESPGTRRPVRLDRSSRLWSTLTLDELVGPDLDSQYELTGVERIGDGPGRLVELELSATGPGPTYPSLTYVVREETGVPARIESRTASGKLARVTEIADWNEVDERPARLVVKDLLRGAEPIEVTVAEVEELAPPEPLFDLEDRSARAELGPVSDP